MELLHVNHETSWENRSPDGRWIGMLKIAGSGRNQVLQAVHALKRRPDFARFDMTDLLNQLVAEGHQPQAQYISGHWLDVNNVNDLERAGSFTHENGG